ncbi:hypothetical protein ES703_62148 [subsurface metagenome]
MRRKNLQACILFVFLSCRLFSENLLVDFLDGNLELKKGNRWVEAVIGDRVPRDTVLRLDEGTVAELCYGDVRITLSKAGNYYSNDLLSASQEAFEWGIGVLLSVKLLSIFEGMPEREASTMGVRAEKVEDDYEFEWVDEEEELLEEGKRLLESFQYEEALAVFQEGLDLADDQDAAVFHFYIGYSYSMLGRSGFALEILKRIEPDTGESYYADFALLKGKLLIESRSFADALRLFDAYLKVFPEGNNAQSAYFLSAFCSKKLGKLKDAAFRLEKAYALDPESELAEKAQKMGQDIKDD